MLRYCSSERKLDSARTDIGFRGHHGEPIPEGAFKGRKKGRFNAIFEMRIICQNRTLVNESEMMGRGLVIYSPSAGYDLPKCGALHLSKGSTTYSLPICCRSAANCWKEGIAIRRGKNRNAGASQPLIDETFLIVVLLNPKVAKVEDAADSRRRGCSRSSLLQTLGNAEDAVSSAFPEGKQHGVFWVSLDVTAGDIQSGGEKWRRALLFLSFHTFRRVVYATVGSIRI